MDDTPTVDVWYSEPVDQIRVTATPGGIALDVNEARAWRDELDEVIQQAEEGDR